MNDRYWWLPWSVQFFCHAISVWFCQCRNPDSPNNLLYIQLSAELWTFENDWTCLCRGNDPFMHVRIFSDRATLSGHDNPVSINLGDEQGILSRLKCCLVTNIIRVSKNKKVITNATLFFTTNSTPRTEQCSRQWQQLPAYAEAKKPSDQTRRC